MPKNIAISIYKTNAQHKHNMKKKVIIITCDLLLKFCLWFLKIYIKCIHSNFQNDSKKLPDNNECNGNRRFECSFSVRSESLSKRRQAWVTQCPPKAENCPSPIWPRLNFLIEFCVWFLRQSKVQLKWCIHILMQPASFITDIPP